MQTIKNSRRAFLRTLYSIVRDDVNTRTGSNIRTVLLSSKVDPRYKDSRLCLNKWFVNPPKDTWTVPLLISLLEVKADNWQVVFDDEAEFLQDDDVNFMIEAVCTA